MSPRAIHTGFQHGADEEPVENEGNLYCDIYELWRREKIKLGSCKLPSHVH